MSESKMRGELLAAFEAHQKRTAKGMIGAGDGDRAREYLKRHVNLSDFEAGWKASREALVIELPARYGNDGFDGLSKQSDGYLLYADEVVKAVEATGVKATA